MKHASWGVWFVRFCISIVATAGVVYGISFHVSDYIVRANTASVSQTMQALQSSIDRLNETVSQNNAHLLAMNESLVEVRSESARQMMEINFIRQDLDKVQSAVQDSGIDIRIATDGPLVGDGYKVLNWGSILREYGVKDGAPYYLEFGN